MLLPRIPNNLLKMLRNMPLHISLIKMPPLLLTNKYMGIHIIHSRVQFVIKHLLTFQQRETNLFAKHNQRSSCFESRFNDTFCSICLKYFQDRTIALNHF